MLYFGYAKRWNEARNLMTYLTRDNRFREIYVQEQKGEVIHNMCEVLDKIEARGREAGREEERRGQVEKLLKKGKSPEEIAEFCGYPLPFIKTVQDSILTV